MTAPLDFNSLVCDGYRVIRRTDRAPEIPILLAAYDETTQSLDVVHPDGVRAPTAFLRSPMAVERHTKMGWSDVTSIWTGSGSATPEATSKSPATSKAAATSKRPTKRATSTRRRAVRRVVAK